MFKFSKGTKKQQKSNTIEADEAIQDMAKHENTTQEIETRLSIPHTWDMTEESRHVYAFYNSQSPKLKKNQISIYGMELNQNKPNQVMITGLVRSTVTKNVRFGDTVILLLDKDGKALAKKTFDLEKLGTMPSNTSRPWEFHFGSDDFLIEDVGTIEEGWKLAFELKREHRLDLEESWKKSLNDQTKAILEKIVKDAAPLGEKEVNLMGVKAEFNHDGDLVTTILIRNGNQDKNVTIEQLPLKVIDATDTEVVRGTFTMNDFTVKANTSKPWSFIFPKDTVQGEPDFSRWKVIAITDKYA